MKFGRTGYYADDSPRWTEISLYLNKHAKMRHEAVFIFLGMMLKLRVGLAEFISHYQSTRDFGNDTF